MTEDKLQCRHRDVVVLPCNWCVSGFCGVDARKCMIERAKLCVC